MCCVANTDLFISEYSSFRSSLVQKIYLIEINLFVKLETLLQMQKSVEGCEITFVLAA